MRARAEAAKAHMTVAATAFCKRALGAKVCVRVCAYVCLCVCMCVCVCVCVCKCVSVN